MSTATIIKGIENLGRVPIVVVTAFRDVNEQAHDAGCSGVIYKPIDVDSLKTILDFHLTGH